MIVRVSLLGIPGKVQEWGVGKLSPPIKPQGFLVRRIRTAVNGIKVRFSGAVMPMLAGYILTILFCKFRNFEV